MKQSLARILAFIVAEMLTASPALADCNIAPSGTRPEGVLVYNRDHNVYQYCAGTEWKALVFNAAPDCTDDSTATCVLDAARDGSDPQFTATNIANGVNILGITGTLAAGGCTGPADCPNVGNVCTDGSVFAGCPPTNYAPIFVTRCDAGRTYSGSCTGTRTTHYWADSSSATNLRVTGVNNMTDGEANTAALTNGAVNGTGDSKSTAGLQPHNVAQYCADLDLHGKQDWYLPAPAEMYAIYTHRTAIGDFNTNEYWTSTERDSGHAYYAWFQTGEIDDWGAKNDIFQIRCARRD